MRRAGSTQQEDWDCDGLYCIVMSLREDLLPVIPWDFSAVPPSHCMEQLA